MSETYPSDNETLAELLGDPLPDDLAIAARREFLEGASYGAADVVVDLILHFIEKQDRGERLSPDDAAVRAFVRGIDALDRAWRGYVHVGGKGAGAVVREASEFRSGAGVAWFIESALERFREVDREWALARAEPTGA